MPITSSEIADVGTQHDGRRWVHEKHIDHLGIEHTRHWLAEAEEDLDAALAAYAVHLPNDLRNSEIGQNIAMILVQGRLAATITDHSTGQENFAVLRSAYRVATETEAIFAGDYMEQLSDAQLRNLFQMTQEEVTTLRANKLTPAANGAANIRATTGA